MIVRVLRAFDKFVEGQVIDSNKYSISENTINAYILNGVLQIVDDYVEKIDVVSDALIYKGKAISGTLTSEPKWQITTIRINGTITSKDTFHNQIWDNRLNL